MADEGDLQQAVQAMRLLGAFVAEVEGEKRRPPACHIDIPPSHTSSLTRALPSLQPLLLLPPHSPREHPRHVVRGSRAGTRVTRLNSPSRPVFFLSSPCPVTV